MGLFGKSKEEKIAELKKNQSIRNGKELKKLLKIFKEDRDKIEKQTGKRPEIDDTTKLFMQKVLNVWMSEGRDIDDEKFWPLPFIARLKILQGIIEFTLPQNINVLNQTLDFLGVWNIILSTWVSQKSRTPLTFEIEFWQSPNSGTV